MFFSRWFLSVLVSLRGQCMNEEEQQQRVAVCWNQHDDILLSLCRVGLTHVLISCQYRSGFLCCDCENRRGHSSGLELTHWDLSDLRSLLLHVHLSPAVTLLDGGSCSTSLLCDAVTGRCSCYFVHLLWILNSFTNLC